MTRGTVGRSLLLASLFLVPVVVLLWLRPPTDEARASALRNRQTERREVEIGRRLYLTHCSTCHGARGQGTDLGPPIVGLGPAVYHFQLSTGRMPLDRPVDEALRKPPAFNERQIFAIVAYLTSLGDGGIPIPRVELLKGSLTEGQRLYEDNCAPCHGTAGNGGAVGRQIAPALHRATPTQIAEAMRIGPGAMPVFDPVTMSDDELDSVVRYVVYLRDPEDPGGAGLGRTGPILEGFVALLLGLGATILVTRFLGERS